MKNWDIVLFIEPAGYAGSLDSLADTLADCLDDDQMVLGSTVSGDLQTGQLDVHLELMGSEDVVESVAAAIRVLHEAVVRCGAICGGGVAEVTELASPVVGVEAHPIHLPSERYLVPA